MPKMSSPSEPRGKQGEDYTAALLVQQGMRILARNWHSRWGEIDLIAVDRVNVCFVEVKTRRAGSMVSGGEAVSRSKQRKIIQTALCWLGENPCELQPRFDVCIVTTEHGKTIAHEYLAAAFDGGAYEG